MSDYNKFHERYLSKTDSNGRLRLGDDHQFASNTKNPNDIHELLDHGNPMIRSLAARNHNASVENLSKALNDRYHESVRASAASNPNATKEHLYKALTDFDMYVKSGAKENPNYKKYFPAGHYVSEGKVVAHNIKDIKIAQKANDHELINKLLDNINPKVAELAIGNNGPSHNTYYPNGNMSGSYSTSNASKENIDKALLHKTERVSKAATRNKNYKIHYPNGHEIINGKVVAK